MRYLVVSLLAMKLGHVLESHPDLRLRRILLPRLTRRLNRNLKDVSSLMASGSTFNGERTCLYWGESLCDEINARYSAQLSQG
jgi:hypothetical protein